MPEPITAVWGVYNRARELVMLKPYDCTDNGWPEGYTVERLPIATPEMVADKERLDWLDQCDVRLLDNLIGRIADGDPSRIVIDSHRMDGDVARAAGGAQG